LKDFRQLQVWQKAHTFTLALYPVTKIFPTDERFGLTSQLRRAAVSIASNIAEGCGRQGDAELSRFCQIAMGSASEVEYQLELARDLNFIPQNNYQKLNEQLLDVKRMLNGLIKKLNANR